MRTNRKLRKFVRNLFREAFKRIDPNFHILVDFHIQRITGKEIDELLIEEPWEFDKAFKEIFGEFGMSVILDTVSQILLDKYGISVPSEDLYAWFKREGSDRERIRELILELATRKIEEKGAL